MPCWLSGAQKPFASAFESVSGLSLMDWAKERFAEDCPAMVSLTVGTEDRAKILIVGGLQNE